MKRGIGPSAREYEHAARHDPTLRTPEEVERLRTAIMESSRGLYLAAMFWLMTEGRADRDGLHN